MRAERRRDAWSLRDEHLEFLPRSRILINIMSLYLSLSDSGTLLEVVALLVVEFAAIYALHVVRSHYILLAAVQQCESWCFLRKVWLFLLSALLYLCFDLFDFSRFVAEERKNYFRLA